MAEPEVREIAPFATGPVLAIAGVVAAVHLVVAGRFGWHRDEFYYLASGRHLAWGYVDQPPLTPLLARLAGALPGGVWPLRIVAIAAEAGAIVLAGALARELGGRRRAQSLAALVVAGCPIFVGSALLLGTTGIDQLFWVAVLVLVTRALRRSSTSTWIWAGIVAGLGLENKQSILALLVGIGIGLVWTRRDALRTAGPWCMGAIALLLWSPNLIWNATNGWPSLTMARAISDQQGGLLGSLAQLPLLVFLLTGIVVIGVWLQGVRWLWRDPDGRPDRWMVVVAVVAVALTVLGGGKSYYPAPAWFGLFAAGAVALERRDVLLASPWRDGWFRLAGASLLVSVLVSWPVFGPRVASALRPIDREPMETYGWPGFARQVADAARDLPPGTVVYAGNYGEAGALETFGGGVGLRFPVTSAHNAWATWGRPAGGSPDSVLAVTLGGPDRLRRAWNRVERVGRITLPTGLHNVETDGDATIYRCSDPVGTWAEIWPTLTSVS
jgi:4-amino-4-deoxy-L-arabinose transferase-like glycosyltransferase